MNFFDFVDDSSTLYSWGGRNVALIGIATAVDREDHCDVIRMVVFEFLAPEIRDLPVCEHSGDGGVGTFYLYRKVFTRLDCFGLGKIDNDRIGNEEGGIGDNQKKKC